MQLLWLPGGKSRCFSFLLSLTKRFSLSQPTSVCGTYVQYANILVKNCKTFSLENSMTDSEKFLILFVPFFYDIVICYNYYYDSNCCHYCYYFYYYYYYYYYDHYNCHYRHCHHYFDYYNYSLQHTGMSSCSLPTMLWLL